MGCLTNSVSFRLKHVIYWKNFYFINNYNYSYLIYNDSNFIFFLESYFLFKVTLKFNWLTFFYKKGMFFSHIKFTKYLYSMYLFVYFNYLLIPYHYGNLFFEKIAIIKYFKDKKKIKKFKVKAVKKFLFIINFLLNKNLLLEKKIKYKFFFLKCYEFKKYLDQINWKFFKTVFLYRNFLFLKKNYTKRKEKKLFKFRSKLKKYKNIKHYKKDWKKNRWSDFNFLFNSNLKKKKENKLYGNNYFEKINVINIKDLKKKKTLENERLLKKIKKRKLKNKKTNLFLKKLYEKNILLEKLKGNKINLKRKLKKNYLFIKEIKKIWKENYLLNNEKYCWLFNDEDEENEVYTTLKGFKYLLFRFFKINMIMSYYVPLFLFFKKLILYFYYTYFFIGSKNFIKKTNLNVYIIFRSGEDLSANLFMYLILGKLARYYKLPKILYIANKLASLYVRKKMIRGYKIICAGRFTRKDRAYYNWKHFGVSLNSTSSSIDFCWRTIALKYSLCVIKIWICK